MSYQLKVGETYLMSVPPGWIVAGTIAEMDDTDVFLKDAIYIEGIADGHSALGSVPAATTAAELKRAVTKSYPVRDGYGIRREAIFHRVPCARDMTPLSRSEDAATIKRAAGK